jgi:hypothetical protein
MECSSGRFHFDKYDFGIIPGGSKEQNYCLNNDITKNCTGELDKSKVFNYLNETCFEKTECEINVQTIKSFITNTESAKGKQCLDETANFFVQIPCSFHKDDL